MAKHSRQTTRLQAFIGATATLFLLGSSIAYLAVAVQFYGAVQSDVQDRQADRAPVATGGPLSVRDECVQALTYPSQSNAEKTWLRTCRDALATPPVPSPTVAPTPTASPTQSPTPAPTTPSATPTAAPTPTPTPSPAGCTGQANPDCTGVPAGWVPVITRTGDLTITQANSTWTDMRVTGSIFVLALNVHLTRVEVIGGIIDNEANGTCYNGLTLDQVSVIQGAAYSNLGNDGAVGPGGYTARDSKIESRVEGFRAGGKSDGCGVVTLINVYIHVTPPRPCPGTDWHGDGIQVYDGALDATNVTAWLDELGGCGGTAPYFQAGATFNNSPPVIDGMLVRGGGYSFRLLMAGSVKNLHVVDGSWFYGPVDVICSQLTAWSADVVRIDANWQTTAVVRTIPC